MKANDFPVPIRPTFGVQAIRTQSQHERVYQGADPSFVFDRDRSPLTEDDISDKPVSTPLHRAGDSTDHVDSDLDGTEF